jgi:hypothetical protein
LCHTYYLTKQKGYQNTFPGNYFEKISIHFPRICSAAEGFFGQIGLVAGYEKYLIIKLPLQDK